MSGHGTGLRWSGCALSIAAHLLAIAALMNVRPDETRTPEPEPMTVALVSPIPPPPPPPPPPEPPKRPQPQGPKRASPSPPPKPPAPAQTPPRRVLARAAKPSPTVPPIPVAPAEEPVKWTELAGTALAQATTAGPGSGGGGGSGSGGGGTSCNVALWLQQALREDREVQAAFSRVRRETAGKAVVLWSDDWIRTPGQDGAGLAVVREAIMFEVLSMPAECRSQPMRGYVVLSLDDGPGATRLAFGADGWRWGDLLIPRRSRSAR